MSTEATQGTGADVADLESMFAAEPDEFPASGEQTQNQQADTQTQHADEAVEFDADGNPLVAATPGEDENIQLDENGEPIVDENANQNGELVIPDDHKIVLTIDGKEQEFTFGDLKASAQKFEGANRKFEEAAAIRKEYTEKAQNLGVREGQLGQVLQYYIDQSQQFMQANQPDWAKLIAENPQEYLVQRHNWEKKQADLAQAHQVQLNLQRQQAEQAAASQAVRVQEAMTEVVKAIPEWSDPQKRAAGAQAIGRYLESQGIPAQMQAQIDSAPVLLIARKAMLYDQAVANAKAKRTNGGGVRTTAPAAQTQANRPQGRVERPGAGTPAQTAARQQNLSKANAAKAFSQNPSVDTLANFFE